MLKARILTAVVGLPVVAAAVYWGGAPLFVLIWALTLLALGEFWAMLKEKGLRGEPIMAAAGATAMIAAGVTGRSDLLIASLVASTAGALVLQVLRRAAYTVLDAQVTLAGLLYVGLFGSYLGLLRTAGVWPLALALGVAWATDTAAYLVGSRFGRRKLCPDLSPGKTVAGAFGGLAGGLVVGLLGGLYLAGWGLFRGLAFGFGVSLAAEAGDLIESALKRYCGVKDAGRILPGHGGVLDRFDSLLLAAPVAYYILRLVA